MSNLLLLFANNILPIFILAGLGWLAGKHLHLQSRTVSQLAFYIFSPCLIFDLLNTSQLEGEEVVQMASFTLIVILVLGALTWLVGRFLRLERRLLTAVLLVVMFANAGNFGLSLNLFAFGETALAYASLYFVVSAVLMYTLGVLIASLGSSSLRSALLGLFKIPTVYATVIALLFNVLGWRLPLPLERAVSLSGQAAIPVLMVLMGIQLQQARFSRQNIALSLTNLMRLIVSPALALALSPLFGLQSAAWQAGIAQSGTPSAIVTTVLATEFDVEPAFVTTAVFTSTLLCPITLTPLLAYLGA